jgi:hypothetical protein
MSMGTHVVHHPLLMNNANALDDTWTRVSAYIPSVSTEMLYTCIIRTSIDHILVKPLDSMWFSRPIEEENISVPTVVECLDATRTLDVIPTGFQRSDTTQTLMVSINDSTVDDNWFSSDVFDMERLKKMTYEFVQRTYGDTPGVLHVNMNDKEWIRRLRLWATENSVFSAVRSSHNIEIIGVRCASGGVEYRLLNLQNGESEWLGHDILGIKNDIHVANFLFRTLPGVVHCALGPNVLCSLSKPSTRQKIENLWAFGIVDEFERREIVEKMEQIRKYRWSKRTQVDAYTEMKISQLSK